MVIVSFWIMVCFDFIVLAISASLRFAICWCLFCFTVVVAVGIRCFWFVVCSSLALLLFDGLVDLLLVAVWFGCCSVCYLVWLVL